jgi:hydroxymethylglutaryl-CoA lyase
MTLASVLDTVSVRDVTLRDGLQLTKTLLDTDTKVDIARGLLALGVPELEIGSLARPELVPTMADTLDLVERLEPEELDRCWLWVATPGHVRRAGAAGARNVQYCLSVSDAHNNANVGRSTQRSLDTLPEAVEAAGTFDGRIQLCLATAFSCPYTGITPAETVLRIVADDRAAGVDDIIVCDTIGQATPTRVRRLVTDLVVSNPQRRIGFHGHDTWGMGVANTLAAIDAGAQLVDGCLGGLGGCPFAPGASGNTSTEDILFALQPKWATAEVLTELAKLSERLLTQLGEPDRSRAARALRASPKAILPAILQSSADQSTAFNPVSIEQEGVR